MTKQVRTGLSNKVRTSPPPILRALDKADYDDAVAILRDDGWALELAQENPCLFFLLARAGREQGLTVDEIRSLTHLPRRELLAALDCSATASAERLLRRCVFSQLNDLSVLALRALVSDLEPAWRRHLRRPNLDLLSRISFRHWQYVVPVMDVLMHEDCDEPESGPGIDCGYLPNAPLRRWVNINFQEILQIIDIIEQEVLMEDDDEDQSDEARQRMQMHLGALSRCRSAGALEGLHMQLTASTEWEELVRTAVGDKPWPVAPLPGCEYIEPVASAQEILDESRMMHHCVASYASRVMQRQGYVYRVLQPQRATLYIEASNGNWAIREIRLAFNEKPGDETVSTAQKWLTAVTRTRHAMS